MIFIVDKTTNRVWYKEYHRRADRYYTLEQLKPDYEYQVSNNVNKLREELIKKHGKEYYTFGFHTEYAGYNRELKRRLVFGTKYNSITVVESIVNPNRYKIEPEKGFIDPYRIEVRAYAVFTDKKGKQQKVMIDYFTKDFAVQQMEPIVRANLDFNEAHPEVEVKHDLGNGYKLEFCLGSDKVTVGKTKEVTRYDGSYTDSDDCKVESYSSKEVFTDESWTGSITEGVEVPEALQNAVDTELEQIRVLKQEYDAIMAKAKEEQEEWKVLLEQQRAEAKAYAQSSEL